MEAPLHEYEEENNNPEVLVDDASQPEAEKDDTKQYLKQQLDKVLKENEEQRRLLEAAAANGTLLAEKYFALEVEFDLLTTKYMETKQMVEDLEKECKYNQALGGSVQKCIDLEQKLNTHMREQENWDEARSRQELELNQWRAKATATLRDNAILKEMASVLEKERDNAIQSRQHVILASRKVQMERDDLLNQVKEITERLNKQMEKEQRLALSHEIKLQKIQRLEAIISELQDSCQIEAKKCMDMVEVAKQHEQNAKELSNVVNGLKHSMSSLQIEYNMVIEKHQHMMSIQKEEQPALMTGWDHLMMFLSSVKDYIVDLTHKVTGYQHLVN